MKLSEEKKSSLITFGKVDDRSLRCRNSADSVMRSIMDPLCMISPEGGPGGSEVPGTGWWGWGWRPAGWDDEIPGII